MKYLKLLCYALQGAEVRVDELKSAAETDSDSVRKIREELQEIAEKDRDEIERLFREEQGI